MEDKEHPPSFVIGYNTRARHESIKLPKYIFYVLLNIFVLKMSWVNVLVTNVTIINRSF